jgi:hypothetical protein
MKHQQKNFTNIISELYNIDFWRSSVYNGNHHKERRDFNAVQLVLRDYLTSAGRIVVRHMGSEQLGIRNNYSLN